MSPPSEAGKRVPAASPAEAPPPGRDGPETIRLYGAETGNCRRAAIALEEAGIPYRAIRLDLRGREHKSAAFLSLNPRGLVPILVVEGPGANGLTLTQSNAIMLYAASRSAGDLAPGPDLPNPVFFDRLFYFVTEFMSYSGAAFALETRGDTGGAAFLSGRAIDALLHAESFLGEGGYMAGDRFSLVDIAAYTGAFASRDRLDWARSPALRAWYDRVGARPGVRRGMAAFQGVPQDGSGTGMPGKERRDGGTVIAS